ncbi:MAG: hypothetical protein AAFP17_04820 [Pseudomonadota bacterium]
MATEGNAATTAQDHLPRDALLARFDARIDELAEKVTQLEGKKGKKSVAERLGIWGGIIALAISLPTGFVTLYDGVLYPVIYGETVAAKADEDAARELLAELNRINKEHFEARAAGDFARAAALLEANAPLYESTLRELEVLFLRRPSVFSKYERWLIAGAFLEIGNTETASRVAETMTGMVAAPFEKAQLEIFRGRILSAPGPLFDPAAARQRFQSAEAIIRADPNPTTRVQAEVPLVNWWLQAELWLGGECAEIERLSTRLEQLVSDQSEQPLMARSYADVVAPALATAAQRCG